MLHGGQGTRECACMLTSLPEMEGRFKLAAFTVPQTRAEHLEN